MPHADHRTVDFFAREALPAPRTTPAEAELLAVRLLGTAARAEALGSQQDANFLLRDGDGAALAVLKVANPAFGPTEVEAQDAAADLVAAAHPGLRVATVLRRPDGTPRRAVVESGSGPAVARLLRHLPGGTLSGPRHLSPRTVAAMGTVAARVSTALRDFRHPGLERVLQWDLRHADRVVERLAGHVAEPERRAAVLAATAGAWSRVRAVAATLPVQAVHLDLTDDNLVRRPDSPLPVPDGVIDFGDLTASWAVSELAVTLSSLLHHDGVEPHHVLPAVRAFHALRPLSAEEAAALWPLVVLRAAGLVVSGRQQAAVDADNAYATGALEREWRIFEQATRLPLPVMTHLVADAAGYAAPPTAAAPPAHPLLRGLTPDRFALLDLATESDAMDGGAWLGAGAPDTDATGTDAPDTGAPDTGAPDTDATGTGADTTVTGVERRAAAAVLAGGAAVARTPYGRARLSRTPVLRTVSPATVATGVDLWPGAELVAQAPGAASVLTAAPGLLELAHDGRVLVLEFDAATRPSVSAGAGLHGGEELVRLPAGSPARLALRAADGPAVPALVRPEYAAGWLPLTADPAPLLGLDAVATDRTGRADLLARRAAVFATVQEHYYAEPPRIERGWRHHLVSTDGRAYLDIVNNVTPLGHAHPGVERAVARQLRRLNTNSRFHYASVVEFTERLAALLPDPLDTVFLVNSGSEAVDLGLRLAVGASGRPDVVAVREAYHGWTYASDAVSTSLQDNPNALATRPSWVHTVDSPNPYRGRHRGADAVRYAPEAVAVVDALAAAGRPAGAFVSETFYGNAGGVALPDGYLAQVYAAVRRHGGLAVADEVQAGYGRLGEWFWGFEQQRVVPDVVCVAKAMGNGHPLGAVVTTREIAERYRDQGYFFSSTGGSPVSSAVGLAVLDALRDEDLQGNAVRVGGHLKRRLRALADRYRIVGAVHGSGLYLGLELVRDRATLEPATEETAELCDRMLDLGVVVQPTGDHLNVLKIKPPLCLDTAAADFFADTLDLALAQLGHGA
ncbi:4-aminobutyrate aminotransferase [Kitasatospora phosalacinea]|uniref:4-aminobutyrate aminotransferase n=1 Tax=Kitasatospora phosalacinea TaxID=2065 RepID=A0A9W6QFW0_9ACTN|nr:aminotransferase class III-fold pyridoxal phosphate-dependent enzyme [Kitasatospora phosalacinea]GLW74108.1 4-aminobutyrate aminotransferase [Kitasatospora phosalacinea]